MRFLPALLVAAVVAALPADQARTLPPLVVVRLDDGSPVLKTRPAAGSTAVTPDRQAGPQAPQGRTLSPLAVTRLEEPGASAILDAGRPLSLRLAAPMPIR